MEKAAVLTSIEATLLLATIAPSNQPPGSIFRVETHMRTIRGGASGAAMGGVGQAFGLFADTMRFEGTATGWDEHPTTGKNKTPLKSGRPTLMRFERMAMRWSKHAECRKDEAPSISA